MLKLMTLRKWIYSSRRMISIYHKRSSHLPKVIQVSPLFSKDDERQVEHVIKTFKTQRYKEMPCHQ